MLSQGYQNPAKVADCPHSSILTEHLGMSTGIGSRHGVLRVADMESSLALVPVAEIAGRIRKHFDDWFASLSPSTRRNHALALDQFAEFVRASDRKEAAIALCEDALKARDLALQFRTWRRDRGDAPGTINWKLSALRVLYRHVVGADLVIQSVRNVKRRKASPGGVETVELLLEQARKQKGLKALRDTALVATVHDSGLRRSEAATLRIQDLDLDGRKAFVMGKGKQGEREAVDLSIPSVEALRAYLATRPDASGDAPVFVSLDRARKGSGGLTADGIHSVLAGLSLKVGLAHAIAPHDLRRFGARALAKAGADAETLRMWGRWADYRTPARYVGEVAEKGREAVDLLAKVRQVV